MMRISTLLTALAVVLAASALATPSFAQRRLRDRRVPRLHGATRPAGITLRFRNGHPAVVPAHSASKTRVNALMLGTHNHGLWNMGPRFRGDERRVIRGTLRHCRA